MTYHNWLHDGQTLIENGQTILCTECPIPICLTVDKIEIKVTDSTGVIAEEEIEPNIQYSYESVLSSNEGHIRVTLNIDEVLCCLPNSFSFSVQYDYSSFSPLSPPSVEQSEGPCAQDVDFTNNYMGQVITTDLIIQEPCVCVFPIESLLAQSAPEPPPPPPILDGVIELDGGPGGDPPPDDPIGLQNRVEVVVYFKDCGCDTGVEND
jgi:hypothetical protein